MSRYIPKNIEDVIVGSKIIMRYLDSFLNSLDNYNKIADFSLEKIEDCLFLFMTVENGTIDSKSNLNIDATDLAELYKLLYKEFKEKYLNSVNVRINLEEVVDLIDPENPFLRFYIQGIHRNLISFEFKNFGEEREILEAIKADWILLVKEKKASKKR